jgi:hypothetical protein
MTAQATQKPSLVMQNHIRASVRGLDIERSAERVTLPFSQSPDEDCAAARKATVH